MITLINTNRMTPAIAPIGLDYVASAVDRAGLELSVVDLCLEERPAEALRAHLTRETPSLLALSFRNTDDCFWPSGQSFVPELVALVRELRRLSDAPIVAGGVGLSLFAAELVELAGLDFGVVGDGETALPALAAALEGRRPLAEVPGLVYRDGAGLRRNPPSWPEVLEVPSDRSHVDNGAYLRLGGQGSIETKRGCPRRCLYCADPAAKGSRVRIRATDSVADEAEALLAQGVDVIHLCDGELNIPLEHAKAVCEELIRRGVGERARFYGYAAVLPFDGELAALLRRAGFVGLNLTTDSVSKKMLEAYGQPHRREDVGRAIRLCKDAGLTVMLDLLLGGPGETAETVAETVAFLKQTEGDAFGAAVGLRIYPGTPMADWLSKDPAVARHIRRRGAAGPLDLLEPTFYVSAELGPTPAALVRELIADDERFFPPADESETSGDHNYNDNAPLADAIAAGARGAYWDILRKL